MKKFFLALTLSLFVLPADVHASLSALEKAIISQDYAQAKEVASSLLETPISEEDATRVRFYLGLSNLRLGEYAQAKKEFSQLVNLPMDAQLKDRSYLGLFNAHYLSEEYPEALRIITTLDSLNPNSQFKSMIYLKLARVNLKLTNWSKAKDYLNKIISEYPKSMEYYTAKQLLQEKQYFAVQVGAFLDQGSAEKIMNKLKQEGEYSYILETTDKESRTFYRVRVGQMTLLDDARQLKARLAKQGYPTEIYP